MTGADTLRAGPTALIVFAAFIAAGLALTVLAARRTRGSADYWTAGGSLSGRQNGFAIAGDYVSSATFIGNTGLIFLVGFDGTFIAIPALSAFVLLLLLFAEPLRNLGKFTIGAVLEVRYKLKSVRTAAAVGSLSISVCYMIIQLVAGGVILQLLTGIRFELSVLLTIVLVLVYVVLGGMYAATFVQIAKAVIVTLIALVIAVWVLVRVGGPTQLFAQAGAEGGPAFYLPGNLYSNPWALASVSLAFALGGAGLPHLLVRLFTVKDAAAGRRSLVWATSLIGFFFILVTILGLGARALLPESTDTLITETGGNAVLPLLTIFLGGGPGALAADIALAVVAAATFATIVAVVAGLTVTAAGAMTHDLWAGVLRKGQASEREELIVGRVSGVVVALAAMAITLMAGPGINVTVLASQVLAVAASASFPVLLLTLYWRRFTAAAAVYGTVIGLVLTIALILFPPFGLANPAIISVPAGFLVCIVASLITPRQTDTEAAKFDAALSVDHTARPTAAHTPRDEVIH
ncbi:cation acetate symporter [Pseudonocardia sp. NPDC049635]|uniref:solute symporter family protein n=1 Tax=Pseudonocardia sp. NPDC049635 TaxID=3155506 RepID=UPI003410E545